MEETTKEKAVRAWAQDKHVEVVGPGDGKTLNGIVSEFHYDRLYLKGHGWSECYYYHDIQEIRFMDEVAEGKEPPSAVAFPAESYDVEILWECSRQATYLHERIRKGELVLINDETGAGKIVSVSPLGEDVAKERWKWEEFATHTELYDGSEEDEKGIVTLRMGSDAQRTLIGHAPQMLEALEEAREWLKAHHALLDNQALPDKISRVIKKARGGE